LKKRSWVPSFSKIIITDYPAFLASISPILLFLIYILFIIVETKLNTPIMPQVVNAIVYLLLGLTIALIGYLLYRVWLIRRVFQHGSDVQGRIATLSLRRLGGRVGYSYSFGQKRVTSGAALRSNPQTKALRKGERVIIVVDRNNPKLAFIRDVYR
jgi:hypothetical protein